MADKLNEAIEAVKNHKYSFCKFVSPNDAGDTGGHQAGLYIPKNSIQLLFDSPGRKGENLEKSANITWDDGQVSNCRFIYYGKGTRNEYRITRLGRHFNVNDLVVIVKANYEEYLGFCIKEDANKKAFLNELNIREEDTNTLIPVQKSQNEPITFGDFNFRPRARIIKVIGQELISNDVIALVELIKNSYDADALSIDIELNNIFNEGGEIIIKDDGLGMSYEKIVNVWLEPATPDKKINPNNKFSACYKRRLLGEKGIGRFAAHRLGDYIELFTRAKLDCNSNNLDYETHVKIDWTSFTEDKYLSEIPIRIEKTIPNIFKDSSGTLIKIAKIQPWKNTKAVKDAVVKIRGLESPIKPKNSYHHQNGENGNKLDPGISVQINSDDIKLNQEINELKSLAEVLDTAFYKFNAVIDYDGKIIYDYSFERIGYGDVARTQEGSFDDLKNYDVEWFEEHNLTEQNSPGSFEVSFYAWDLDSAALKTAGLAYYYRNIIKPNTGVRIYRDNFRVWPYGEQDNDWLELDLARLNAPKERSVSRNQIFGVVHLSSVGNPKLIDQSNREGLIINEQYEQFYRMVNAALSIFAKERKIDKIKIDKLAQKQSGTDIVSEKLDELKDKFENNHHSNLYRVDVENIKDSYKKHINDILERYMMAAAVGISYSIPIHEMKLRLSSIKHVIEDIERNATLEDKYLRELAKQLSDTEDIITAVSSIMSRQRKQKVNLFKVANNIRVLKEYDLIKYGIDLEITGDKSIEVEATPGLLNTAVLNLVDNAIYWLRAKKIKSRDENYTFIPKINLNISVDDNSHTVFRVTDNGLGFSDPFELLIEPYYSKKSDGLGLGLYLVNEIITRNGGRLTGYSKNETVFELVFAK